MHRVPFNPHQRRELAALGLTDKMMEHIEIGALTTAREMLKRPPRNEDVRGELLQLQKKLTEARDAIERMFEAPKEFAPLRYARSMLTAGQGRHVMGGIRLNESSKSLAAAIEVVEAGIAKVPAKPLRHRSADPYPVELIHDALQMGVLAERGEPDPDFMWPSASPTSPFRQMIGICYEAIDAPHADPERAIKAYLKKWTALHRYLVGQGLVTERPRKT